MFPRFAAPALLLSLLFFLAALVPAQAAESAEALDLVQQKCTVCHDTVRICNHIDEFDHAGWKETVHQMVKHGAKVDAAEQKIIVDYLASSPQNFPDCAPGEGVPEFGVFATLLLLGHPLLMFLNICLTLWVLWMGVQRFRATVLHHKASFPWKRHVRWGQVALVVFFLGMIAGPVMTTLFWGGWGGTGTHFQNGLLMLPLLLIGFFTGRHMDKHKAQRKVLPLVHGANNLLLFLLALCQLTTGAQMVLAMLS